MQKRALDAYRLDPEKWGVNVQVFSGKYKQIFLTILLSFILSFIYCDVNYHYSAPLF